MINIDTSGVNVAHSLYQYPMEAEIEHCLISNYCFTSLQVIAKEDCRGLIAIR